MLNAFGAALSAGGGVLSTLGNKKSKNQARKNRLNQLNQGMNEFQLGSQDAQGNKINFNNERGWGYDLSKSGQAEKALANKNTYLANTLGNMSPSRARNQAVGADYKAAQQQALANQSAGARNALRTGSNVGNIMRSAGQVGSSALQQAMQQRHLQGNALKNQNADNYLSNASNAKNILGKTQGNLLNMMNGPAAKQLVLRQAMSEAAGVPKINGMQAAGSIMQGLGGGASGYAQSQQSLANSQKLMEMISKIYGIGGA